MDDSVQYLLVFLDLWMLYLRQQHFKLNDWNLCGQDEVALPQPFFDLKQLVNVVQGAGFLAVEDEDQIQVALLECEVDGCRSEELKTPFFWDFELLDGILKDFVADLAVFVEVLRGLIDLLVEVQDILVDSFVDYLFCFLLLLFLFLLVCFCEVFLLEDYRFVLRVLLVLFR